MFEKVLFPTDFSEHAQKNLECIGEIPGVREVTLLHVVDATHPSKLGWTHGPEIENAKIRLEEQKKRLESLGLKAGVKVDVITEGDIPRAILETADKEKASLIVMGARGRSRIQGLLLGSVSLNILRHARTHVLILRYNLALERFCPRIISKVLCPTDFSEPSEAALSFVKDLEGVGEVVLVHVVHRGETEEEIEANVKEAKKRLEDIGREASSAGLKVKTHVHVGSPPEEICSVAEEEDISLVAMGRHGKGWLRELLLGSTTHDVARNVKRPFLLVHTGDPYQPP
ncbi:MAG: universal stress protein [Candidatus Hydrothermarchaeota archaeon]